jgi:hypothetical protein
MWIILPLEQLLSAAHLKLPAIELLLFLNRTGMETFAISKNSGGLVSFSELHPVAWIQW